MRLLFWLSIFLTVYTYLLYPAWLYLRSRLNARPVQRQPIFPKISIVMAARNEGTNLKRKLQNIEQLEYPRELVETYVVSDGSTDETNEILSQWSDPGVHAIILETYAGKAVAINRALEAATGEVVVFMDARQRVDRDSVRRLVENFADPVVGCASGALMLSVGEAASPRGVGVYWNMEKSIRCWESASGSVVGATGALYAVRRKLIPTLPAGTILDDVLIPMETVRRKFRVIFESQALAWDNLTAKPEQEFRRKVRTLFGNYQLLRIAPWLLTRENPLRFEFISHKLCRLAVPFALLGIVLASFFLSGPIYRLPLAAAIGIIALTVLAFLRVPLGGASRITDLAMAFVLLNTAAIVAFYYFAVGRKQVWVN